MARYYGKVGFRVLEEIRPGVYDQPRIIEYPYYGDVIRYTKRFQTGSGVNDDLNIDNQISIVADPFAREHFHEIAYILWMGAAWKVSSVEVQFPRLILSIGGVYNGDRSSNSPGATSCSGQ